MPVSWKVPEPALYAKSGVIHCDIWLGAEHSETAVNKRLADEEEPPFTVIAQAETFGWIRSRNLIRLHHQHIVSWFSDGSPG
jgi:hypothetical protein